MSIVGWILCVVSAAFRSRAALVAENLALRQQLAILNQRKKRPKLRPRDRVFWVWLSSIWPTWRDVLVIVQPETVIRWHRQGFRLYWRWQSRRKATGRPEIDPEARALIRRMSLRIPLGARRASNPNWRCWDMTSANHRSPNTWFVIPSRLRRTGATSSTTI